MSDSPFNRQVQHRQKREAILSEAAFLFNSQGSRSTTLADIAERLNLTTSSLYYYVKTKEELIYLCYLNTCDIYDRLLDMAEKDAATGAGRIQAYIRHAFELWRDVTQGNHPCYALLTEIQALKGDQREQIKQRYNAVFLRIRSFVQQGRMDESLSACDSAAAALAIFGASQFAVVWLSHLPDGDTEHGINAFTDIVFNGLSAQADFKVSHFPSFSETPAAFDRATRNQQKQEAFFRAGSAFFNRKGYKGTSLDEIAEALEVTKGAFYYHIKDKPELLYHCFLRSTRMTSVMQASASERAATGIEALALCMHYLFYVQHSSRGPLIRFNLLPSLSAEHKGEVEKSLQQVSSGYGDMIRQGIEDQSIRDIDPFIAEHMLIGAIDTCLGLEHVTDIDDLAKASAAYFKVFFIGLSR